MIHLLFYLYLRPVYTTENVRAEFSNLNFQMIPIVTSTNKKWKKSKENYYGLCMLIISLEIIFTKEANF